MFGITYDISGHSFYTTLIFIAFLDFMAYILKDYTQRSNDPNALFLNIFKCTVNA